MYHASLDRVMTAEKEFLDGLGDVMKVIRKRFRMSKKHAERREFDIGRSINRRPAQMGSDKEDTQQLFIKGKFSKLER